MGTVKRLLAAFAIGSTMLLAGCGGGASLDIVVDGSDIPAFDVIMFANGVRVPTVLVEPGFEQTIELPAGNNFELATSGPVAWTVVTGGVEVQPQVGGLVVFSGITLSPTTITNARYAANTSRAGLLANPVVVTFIATSTQDPSQEAQINIVLTNN
jgi:hypothetical protein